MGEGEERPSHDLCNKAQPPIWSVISEGHCVSLNLSLIECLKLCIVHPDGTYCLNHLLRAALAELAVVS